MFGPDRTDRSSRRWTRRTLRIGMRALAAIARPPSMNVVITFGDAARTFVYRGLNALAEKLKILAQRVSPDR